MLKGGGGSYYGVEEHIVAMVLWFGILAELTEEQPSDRLLIYYIVVPYICKYPTI